MNKLETPPLEQIATRWTVDYGSGEIELTMVGGSTVRRPLDDFVAGSHGSILGASFNVVEGHVELDFSFNETVCLDVGPQEVPEVPVAYLDQNKWISLAQSKYAPQRLRKKERELLPRLYEMAANRQVLLPISSSHMIEAAYKDGRPRQKLATVMLELSRGWQMLNPLKVRLDEFLSALENAFDRRVDSSAQRPTVTLDPGALFSTPANPLPGGWSEIKERLSWAEAFADLFVEDEREADPLALAKANRWASIYSETGEQIRAESNSQQKRRAMVKHAVISDLSGELFTACGLLGIPEDEALQWAMEADFRSEQMPSTNLLFEITLRRLSSKDHHWKKNDLNDLTFLCCAAANCDLVLAENATSHDLRDAQRHTPSKAKICRNLEELISDIERFPGSRHE